MEMLTQYRCQRCMRMYDTEEECKKCEESHIMPVKMISCCWLDAIEKPDDKVFVNANTKLDTTYPMEIHIQMADGQTVTYKPANIKTKMDKLFQDDLKKFGDIMNRTFSKGM